MTTATPPSQQTVRSVVQNLFALVIAVVILGVAAYFLIFREASTAVPPLSSQPFIITDPPPVPQPILADRIIFYDSFEDQALQWDLAPLGQARYEGGALILQDNHYEGWGTARPRLELDNFLLEVYTRWLSGAFGGEYGVRFWLNGTGDYYAFYIRNDGRYVIGKQIDGVWFEVVSAFTPAIERTGGINLMRVEALDSQQRFFINGEYLVDVQTDWQKPGDLMLVTMRPDGTEWLEVAFDNLLVAQHPGEARTAGTELPVFPVNQQAPANP